MLAVSAQHGRIFLFFCILVFFVFFFLIQISLQHFWQHSVLREYIGGSEGCWQQRELVKRATLAFMRNEYADNWRHAVRGSTGTVVCDPCTQCTRLVLGCWCGWCLWTKQGSLCAAQHYFPWGVFDEMTSYLCVYSVYDKSRHVICVVFAWNWNMAQKWFVASTNQASFCMPCIYGTGCNIFLLLMGEHIKKWDLPQLFRENPNNVVNLSQEIPLWQKALMANFFQQRAASLSAVCNSR